MARARLVKPQFFKHYELYLAERDTGFPLRLAFEGLWTQADREGRFRWKAEELKTDILPFDPLDFGAVLDALEARGFIRSYEVDGKRYGVIPTLGDHQTFHVKEPPSRLPAPPERRQAPVRHQSGTVPAPGLPTSDPPEAVTEAVTEAEMSSRTKKPVRAKLAVVNGSWTADATELWVARVGDMDHGRMGRALKRLVDRYGWDTPTGLSPPVRPALLCYCKWAGYKRAGKFPESPDGATRDLTWVKPEKFAETYQEWADMVKPMEQSA